ncbi:MAG: hypothetical protein KF758_05500 [Anaerolineales bacterium]|nr:hypothetical protein [Anaerolineales bacterium]MBX3036351.1 hypothetical protein [Anaerolineales bacterium]
MLSSQETKEYIFRQLDLLNKDSLVEVMQFIEYLQFRNQPILSPSTQGAHVAFGIWSDYPEANDPASFAQALRQNIEKRRSG